MREIKFRAWDKQEECYWSWELLLGTKYHDSADSIFNDDYELEQYTGLRDKNGVEIYEGDIDLEYGVVVYDKATFGFKGKDSHGHDSILILQWAEEREIIGNIHENPDLLN